MVAGGISHFLPPILKDLHTSSIWSLFPFISSLMRNAFWSLAGRNKTQETICQIISRLSLSVSILTCSCLFCLSLRWNRLLLLLSLCEALNSPGLVLLRLSKFRHKEAAANYCCRKPAFTRLALGAAAQRNKKNLITRLISVQ